MLCVVTGFVPIPGHPRPPDDYEKLGERLVKLQSPASVCATFKVRPIDCWLHKYLLWRGRDFTHSTSDNVQKNSAVYHCVQAQKSEFILYAANDCPADVFVWIDYGIFHLKGLTEQHVLDFLERAKYEQTVTIPGCWDQPFLYVDAHPCWRFCGGVMIVPRKWVIEFDLAMKAEYIRWINLTNNLSWEVNCLARIERDGFPIFWYKADHDASMFTNYQGSGLHESESRHSIRAH
jgi:hypothetical protein